MMKPPLMSKQVKAQLDSPAQQYQNLICWKMILRKSLRTSGAYMYLCVNKQCHHWFDNGLSSVQPQAIIWDNFVSASMCSSFNCRSNAHSGPQYDDHCAYRFSRTAKCTMIDIDWRPKHYVFSSNKCILAIWDYGPWFNIKMSSYQYRKYLYRK